MSGGTGTTGAVVSATRTLKLPLALFEWESVAVHVTDVVPNGKRVPEGFVQVAAMLPSTRSLAPTVKVTVAPAAEVASLAKVPGTVSTGAVVSCTVTVKLPESVLPLVSWALQLTVVVPTGNVAPEAGVHVGVRAPSTASFAVAEKLAVAPLGPVASTVMSPGTETVGETPSVTVTLNEALPVLPASSVAVQVTVVCPTENVLPEALSQPTDGLASTASLAETE
jgi:hypothetical protein